MAFRTNSYQQLSFTDSFEGLTSREQKALERSWAKVFAEDIFPAIYGASDPGQVNALGIVETYSAASIIVAADIAAKTADVKLLEIRIAKGMCGKSYVMMTGEVAAVTASVEKAAASLSEDGMLLDKAVIPNPDKDLWKSIL